MKEYLLLFPLMSCLKSAAKAIYLNNQPQIVNYFHPEKGNQLFNLDNCDEYLANESIKKISETRITTESEDYMLPNMVTFLEMYKVGKVEPLNRLKDGKIIILLIPCCSCRCGC